MSNEPEHWRRRLVELRAELQALEREGAESRATVTLDQQSVGRLSRMDALQQQAMAEAASRARRVRLVQIERALKAIEDGEFGWCERCGEEIAPARLEADPAAAMCIACASGGARSSQGR